MIASKRGLAQHKAPLTAPSDEMLASWQVEMQETTSALLVCREGNTHVVLALATLGSAYYCYDELEWFGHQVSVDWDSYDAHIAKAREYGVIFKRDPSLACRTLSPSYSYGDSYSEDGETQGCEALLKAIKKVEKSLQKLAKEHSDSLPELQARYDELETLITKGSFRLQWKNTPAAERDEILSTLRTSSSLFTRLLLADTLPLMERFALRCQGIEYGQRLQLLADYGLADCLQYGRQIADAARDCFFDNTLDKVQYASEAVDGCRKLLLKLSR